ncbi:L1Tco protein [Trypanosoma theileri]|uniref:L1Tco protein n=1 Tax=Trypanosoma theileri TaxID=67003 RepID=A0A1X0NW67_9TRYP|nr:L1Tco protein [Trypanosoma theileri]ORC88946.1 L1Tco protein [Trypanosoma theileri]
METGRYTETDVKPLWHTDLETLLVRRLKEQWKESLRPDTHRYSLCGDRSADLSGTDLITGNLLTRSELVHLARARCGESEFFGRLFWSVRECLPTCRLCNRTPEQSAALLRDTQLSKDNTEDHSSSLQQSRTVPGVSINRREEPCPYCEKIYRGFSNLKLHCKQHHSDRPAPTAHLKCDLCDEVYDNRRSAAQHRMRCTLNPDGLHSRKSGPRRRSHLPTHQPPTTFTNNGPMETLHHILYECPEARHTVDKLHILQDIQTEKYSMWQFLHSKKLLTLLQRLFGHIYREGWIHAQMRAKKIRNEDRTVLLDSFKNTI